MDSIASSIVVAKNNSQRNISRGDPCWVFDAGAETGFQVYSKPTQAVLEEALKAQLPLCAFQTSAHHYEVDLETMVQRNVKTGTTRAVVRLLLTPAYAILDRDSARFFPSMNYQDIVVWMEKHGSGPPLTDRKLLKKGGLMTKATALFHSSKEFPLLLRSDGTPYLIKNKAGKVITGGAKPTFMNAVPSLPASVVKAALKPRKFVLDKDWAVKLVTGTDSVELAAKIVSVEDLTESTSSLLAQFNAFKIGMSEAQELTAFHGTSSNVANKIIHSGFDWRYNERHVFGKGNYFAVTAGYAFGVAPAEGGAKVIIVAKILYSKAARGTSSTMLPPEGFDATVDDEKSPNIYVTYKVWFLSCK